MQDGAAIMIPKQCSKIQCRKPILSGNDIDGNTFIRFPVNNGFLLVKTVDLSIIQRRLFTKVKPYRQADTYRSIQ